MKKRRGYLLAEVILSVAILTMSAVYIVNNTVLEREFEKKLDDRKGSRYQTELLLYGKGIDISKANLNNIEFQLEEESVDVKIGDCNMKLKKYRVVIRSSGAEERIYFMLGRGEDD